jgi:hypothetical protein
VSEVISKVSGGNMSSTILRIYQTLAVEFQTARAEPIYFTEDLSPLPHSRLRHHLLPPPSPLPPLPPLPPPLYPPHPRTLRIPLFDPWET